MNSSKTLSLKSKLVLALLMAGLLPAGLIAFQSLQTANRAADQTPKALQKFAEAVGDKIDRNLFERYGDVQAFGLNAAVLDKSSWYKPGSGENKIAAAANDYAKLYGFYVLSFVVDLQGKVIAVNDFDPSGKAINTAFLYEKNYKDAPWFKAATTGAFLKSKTLDGTYVEAPRFDEDVQKATQGDSYVIGFSAPVKNHEGEAIGVWHNCAIFSLVEEILQDSYSDLKSRGLASSSLILVDAEGKILTEYDPTSNRGAEKANHDPAFALKATLRERGIEAAGDSLSKGDGFSTVDSSIGKARYVVAHSKLDGALGYPGLGWSLVIRLPEAVALADVNSQSRAICALILIALTAILVAAWILGGRISSPLVKGINAIKTIGDEVATAARQLSETSSGLASGSSQQAASLEETSASLEEMSSMTSRNAASAKTANERAAAAKLAAEQGLSTTESMKSSLGSMKHSCDEMNKAMQEIKGSNSQVAKVIKIIDEIAFQTNILALNAAVEAARAGEAGMGFAVVADEVRNLAQRSATAAKQSAEMIEAAILKGDLGAGISTKLNQRIDQVVEESERVHTSLKEISGRVLEVNEMVALVADASREQSLGVDSVNKSVTDISNITQSTAAGAEETASAAEELNAQASSLQDTVRELLPLVGGGGGGRASDTARKVQASAPGRASTSLLDRELEPAQPMRPASHPARTPAATPAMGGFRDH